jgi:hypothetical protein
MTYNPGNLQDVPAGAIPVRLVLPDGSAFYEAGSGGGGGGSNAYAAAAAVTVGTPFTAANGIAINCTAPGNVSLQLAGGPLVIPVYPGFTLLPFAATQVNSSGTTATATYANVTLGSTAIPQTFSSASALTVGVSATAGATLMVICTVAGNMVIALAGSGTLTIPIYPGVLYFPLEVTEINSATATATYYNLS